MLDLANVRRCRTQHEDDRFHQGAAHTGRRDWPAGWHRTWPGPLHIWIPSPFDATRYFAFWADCYPSRVATIQSETHRPVMGGSSASPSRNNRKANPARPAPTKGAIQNSHSWSVAHPPTKMAGAVLRAGFTDVLVTGMLIKRTFRSMCSHKWPAESWVPRSCT
jgi:hypothetical protein